MITLGNEHIENATYQLDKEIGIKFTVLINKCEFEIDSSAKSSLSYFGGSAETANIDVKKCIFVGDICVSDMHSSKA